MFDSLQRMKQSEYPKESFPAHCKMCWNSLGETNHVCLVCVLQLLDYLISAMLTNSPPYQFATYWITTGVFSGKLGVNCYRAIFLSSLSKHDIQFNAFNKAYKKACAIQYHGPTSMIQDLMDHFSMIIQLHQYLWLKYDPPDKTPNQLN